jgi:hypothetical protein
MQNMTQIQKMIGLLIFVVIVLGIFFLQQSHTASKANRPLPTPIAAASGNIVVSAPTIEASVPTDFLVTGKARVFENVVFLRVSSRLLGKVYFEGTTDAQSPDVGQFGPFSARVHLKGGTTLQPNDKLILDVYNRSAKDGSEIDKVTIPLYFSPELP